MAAATIHRRRDAERPRARSRAQTLSRSATAPSKTRRPGRSTSPASTGSSTSTTSRTRSRTTSTAPASQSCSRNPTARRPAPSWKRGRPNESSAATRSKTQAGVAAMTHEALISFAPQTSVERLNDPVRSQRTMYDSTTLRWLPRLDSIPLLVDHDYAREIGRVKQLLRLDTGDGYWWCASAELTERPSWLKRGTRASFEYRALRMDSFGNNIVRSAHHRYEYSMLVHVRKVSKPSHGFRCISATVRLQPARDCPIFARNPWQLASHFAAEVGRAGGHGPTDVAGPLRPWVTPRFHETPSEVVERRAGNCERCLRVGGRGREEGSEPGRSWADSNRRGAGTL